MGCYVEPVGQSKDEWFSGTVLPISMEELLKWEYAADNTTVPIVKIDNGAFRAVAVLYSKKERSRFVLSLAHELDSGYGRPMTFGVANVADVRKVADYDTYLRTEY